jgi:hypothetical protein
MVVAAASEARYSGAPASSSNVRTVQTQAGSCAPGSTRNGGYSGLSSKK